MKTEMFDIHYASPPHKISFPQTFQPFLSFLEKGSHFGKLEYLIHGNKLIIHAVTGVGFDKTATLIDSIDLDRIVAGARVSDLQRIQPDV